MLALLGGCSSSKPMKLPWNTRAHEQARVNAATSSQPQTFEERVTSQQDPNKVFNLAQTNINGGRSYPTGKAGIGEFEYRERVRTKDYQTGDYATKSAWMGDYKHETKAAESRQSWFSKLTARTKTYDTGEARDAGKEVPVRALPGGDRPFLVQGRRQADLDRNGPAAQTPAQSWDGNLTPLTIDDVKKLLNKN